MLKMTFLMFVLLVGLFGPVFLLVEAAPPVRVFLIPHSHCDAGWLYTDEDYFSLYVNNILDSVTDELTNNPDYRLYFFPKNCIF